MWLVLAVEALQFGVGESKGFVGVEGVLGVPGPYAVDDFEAEIAAKRVLDDFRLVAPGRFGRGGCLPEHILVQVDRRFALRHHFMVARVDSTGWVRRAQKRRIIPLARTACAPRLDSRVQKADCANVRCARDYEPSGM